MPADAAGAALTNHLTTTTAPLESHEKISEWHIKFVQFGSVCITWCSCKAGESSCGLGTHIVSSTSVLTDTPLRASCRAHVLPCHCLYSQDRTGAFHQSLGHAGSSLCKARARLIACICESTVARHRLATMRLQMHTLRCEKWASQRRAHATRRTHVLSLSACLTEFRRSAVHTKSTGLHMHAVEQQVRDEGHKARSPAYRMAALVSGATKTA